MCIYCGYISCVYLYMPFNFYSVNFYQVKMYICIYKIFNFHIGVGLGE